MTYNNYNILMTSYQNVMNHRYMELREFLTLFFCAFLLELIRSNTGETIRHLHYVGMKY